MSLNITRILSQHLQSTGGWAGKRANKNRWGVILAGGDGSRLLPLTRLLMGDDRPKQFCPIGGEETLLERTSRRISRSIDAANTAVVVTETHEPFYRSALHHMTPENLIVQPINKGTAPAILYSLLRIDKVAPNATVAFFPSDHHFSDDEKFMSHVEAAFEAVAARPDLVVLLGIIPDAPEEQYGWIEPGPSLHTNASGHFYQVRRFWEKPSRPLASELMEKGCLWNSFVMIGRVRAWLAMIRQATPDLYRKFALTKELNLVAERKLAYQLYRSIPSINFSRAVLANRPEGLALFPVSGVEWSDLGAPARVISTFGPSAHLTRVPVAPNHKRQEILSPLQSKRVEGSRIHVVENSSSKGGAPVSHGNLSESELRIVLEARAQSRAEAHEWERLSRRWKAVHLVNENENTSVDEFHGRFSQIESEGQRAQAYRANA